MNLQKTASYSMTIAALGVVFGDIGTSPLYALKVTMGKLMINQMNVLGVLSLILWTLLISISFKYLIIIFRADNEGEGGILALLALMKYKNVKYVRFFYLISIFGAGLLLGDGMLTPAISVISALEGLEAISPSLQAFILPMACVIFIFLFTIQSRGTAKLGFLFGPIMLVWFLSIAALGCIEIINYPLVLKAINPYYAIHFLVAEGVHGYLVLGGIFLVITGGEALFADIGHFGKKPIRQNWFILVLPSLLLSYFGQGAFLISHPEAIDNPIFSMVPVGLFIPFILLATAATIIASQAVISATFSLTKQAILLGLFPKLAIVQLSKDYSGQIYVPQINSILFIGTLGFTLIFQTSENLAQAYGIAVNGVMLIVDVMVGYTALAIWKWPKWIVALLFGAFTVFDLAFLGSNSHKFLTGGWVPVTLALLIAFVMYTWRFGLDYLIKNYYTQKEDIAQILKLLEFSTLNKLKGVTAIFITDSYDKSGGSLLHFLKLNQAMPEHVLVINCAVQNIPYVHYNQRYQVTSLSPNVGQITLNFGFMQTISIPRALEKAAAKNRLPFEFDLFQATYFVEIPNVMASKSKKSLHFFWQEKMFAFLIRNYSANLNIEFFQLPFNRTIAIGTYYII